MPYEVSEIKVIRKKLGLTQAELAKRAGVSQSLIAKIESGKIDPAYSNVKKIFVFLDSLKKKKELKAEDVMHSSIISVEPSTPIKAAISKMKRHGISQIPVIRGRNCVGLVSETTILNSLLEKKAEKVEEIMEDCPPVISKNTPMEAVSDMLRFVPIVIVSDKGRFRGIITKSDILGRLSAL
jgi:predicted transcriptional regulator